MLNEQVESLLSQDGHGVYVFKSRVDVLDTATINHAENYIQMRQISDHYEVGKIRRGRFSKIAETEDKDLASAYTYILSKAIYDEPIDGDIAAEIRRTAQESSVPAAKVVLGQHLSPRYYSIGSQEFLHMNLVPYYNTYSLFYQGEEIIRNMDAGHAFSVLYTYGKKLEQFDMHYNRLHSETDIPLPYYELSHLYIFQNLAISHSAYAAD